MKAAYWEALPNGQAACHLCPIGCRLRPGQIGPCGTRENREGEMAPLHYGRVVSLGVDPIEKKPLYHFHPGRAIMSVAAPGCNLHCLFCQNWSISQGQGQRTSEVTCEELVNAASRQNSIGLAYTYSEPLVWYEFVRDCSSEAARAGLKNVLVTNGFLNRKPLQEIVPHIHAANIDLKSMDDRFYRKICKAQLKPVLEAIELFLAAGVHVELTNLLIPGHNDAEDQIKALVDHVAALEHRHDAVIPLHFSAYHPAFKMEAPPTPRSTLLRARKWAREKLGYVYLGNVSGTEGRDTFCPGCGQPVVERSGYTAAVHLILDEGKPCCGNCGAPSVIRVS